MNQITPEGLRVANELAQRYGFSQDAVVHMMVAVLQGRAGMAQFNHPEFGGSGQWMRGGMLMLGDMFNNALKARVDGLCQAIASQLASQPELFPVGSFQAQTQSGVGQQMQVGAGSQQMQVGGGSQQMQVGGAGQPIHGAGASQQIQVGGANQQAQMAVAGQPSPTGFGAMAPLPPLDGVGAPLFTPDPRDSWWPQELGTPSAIGAQNEVRYAFFPAVGRLAVQVNGRVSVYDTGEHHIAGLSQQQGSGGAVVFTTPAGSLSLASLSAVPAGVSQQAQSSAAGSQQQQQRSAGMAPMASMAPLGGFGSVPAGTGQPAAGGMAPLAGMAPMTGMAPMAFSPMAAVEPWWPAELGSPASTGAQNDLRYAFFPAARRLVVERQGQLSVHDTGDLRISGCSQSGAEGEVRFSTGGSETVALSSLPTPPPQPEPQPADATAAVGESSQADVLDALAKLGALKDQGILTEAEFSAKKAELLKRL